MVKVPKDCVFYYAGTEHCSPLHNWKSIRDHHLFHVIFAGKGFIRANGQEYQLSAGQGFVFFPGMVTDYQADREDPWYYGWIGFSGSQVETYLADIGLDRHHLIYTPHSTEHFISYAQELITDLERSNHIFEQTAILYRFLYRLDTFKQEVKPSPQSTETEIRTFTTYYEAMEYYIERNYSNPHASIQAMAQWIGLSRSYLSTFIHKRYGKSPQTLLVEYRMIKARELLTTTALPIGNIARSVGYEDPLVFSRQFKRFFTKSPKNLRKESHFQNSISFESDFAVSRSSLESL